jgi:hypothetical protein
MIRRLDRVGSIDYLISADAVVSKYLTLFEHPVGGGE